MTTNEQEPEVLIAVAEDEEEIVQGDIMSFLNGDDIAETQPASPLEKNLAKVDKKKELAAQKPEDAHLRFRGLLTDKQRTDLEAAAPQIAAGFIADVNKVMVFGERTLTKLKDTSRQMLEAQKKVEIPEADDLVNDLLRELDGFEKKYKNAKFDQFGKKFLGIFKTAKYSLTTMVREMKPIEDKLDMAETTLERMDLQLADNVSRGQILHQQIVSQMNEVVIVLASLEEIIDNIRAEYEAADKLQVEASAKGQEYVEYKGETISMSELTEIRERLTLALSETEKSWFDWRQQFFLGWANAPATRNLVGTTIAFRRRLKVFKDMGLQSSRTALVNWKQAAEVRVAAEKGEAFRNGANSITQRAYKEIADTTKLVADASQAPIITEETILSVIESVKTQARAVVEADRNGRVLRAKNLQALERGEVQIKDEMLAMQAQLAQNARADHTLEGGGMSGQRAISSSNGDDLLSNLGAS